MNRCAGQFGPSVGGHDGVGEVCHALLRCCSCRRQFGQRGLYLIYREGDANDAGGGWKNLGWRGVSAAWPVRGRLAGRPCNPGLPVAQLALPEFTITARIPPRLAANDARPTSRGAATTRFLVNNAAAVVPGQASTRARSGRPLALIPAQAAEKLEPGGQSHVIE